MSNVTNDVQIRRFSVLAEQFVLILELEDFSEKAARMEHTHAVRKSRVSGPGKTKIRKAELFNPGLNRWKGADPGEPPKLHVRNGLSSI